MVVQRCVDEEDWIRSDLRKVEKYINVYKPTTKF